VQQVDALGAAWSYVYGPGLVTMLTDPLGNAWAWSYDASSRITSLTDPASGAITYTYDAVGRPVTQARPLGQTTSLAYDPASGYQNSITRPGGIHTGWSFTPRAFEGMLFYDVTSIVAPDGSAWVYGYDAGGN